jgi:putative SOS response-associated peptidase YedK
MINARAETIADKPSYRDALQTGRCLIITDGYYEWAKTRGGKTPFRFQMTDGRPFVFAGLWDKWRKGKESLETCTVITTPAADSITHIHDRMPAILNFSDSLSWLRSKSGADVLPLLRPYAQTDLEMFAVSRAVNNAANDTPECIQPAIAMPDERASQPLDLFT